MSGTERYEVLAFNTATASTNKIHDDAVAAAYGFRGGLVPGADVYAYMTHLPAAAWGSAWLSAGSISARFVQPVYDGQLITVTGSTVDDPAAMDLFVTAPDGTTCATGRATRSRTGESVDQPLPDRTAVPSLRPPASAQSLPPGAVLGSLTEVFDATAAVDYLADVRETLPLYAERRIAHPGWLLRLANRILAVNVQLGPWIHVSSDVTLSATVADGETLDVRAAVADEFERGGHRFVRLGVAVLSSSTGHVVQRVTHTAIHTPRRPTP